jgi:tight adherence protein B
MREIEVRLRRTLPAALLPALLLIGLVAGPAYAEDGTISFVEPGPGGLQVLVSVPATATVDLDEVSVTIDDEPAESTAALAEGESVQRTTVLAIDTSQSMRGARFEAAKVAAREFVGSAPDDVSIGIVTFDSDVEEALSPTQDRASAIAVIEALELSKQTLLYDGVLAALDTVGTEGARSLLVLSDGADTSDTALADVTAAVEAAEVRLDVVALDQQGEALLALNSLAESGAGEVISADPAALQAAFAAQAAALAAQVLVTVQVPPAIEGTEGTIKVRLPSSTGDITAQVFGTVRAAALGPALVREEPWTPPSWALYVGPIALGFGLVFAIVLAMPRPKEVTAADRVTQYTASMSKPADNTGPLLDTDVAFASAKETAANMLKRNQDLDARISRRLEQAGSELKSSEWLLLHGGIFFVSGLLGLALGGGNPIIGALFLIGGVVLPWLYLGFRKGRRRKAFNQGLPDTLQLMSGSLAAGLSLAQSIDTIVREGADPIASEFRRVLVETRLGVSLEDALEGIGERFESRDFEWVVMAIKIQRQVGGNLAELLDTVAATMREREYVRRQVAALAAEGKLSAWVLGGLPPLFMVYLLLTNYDYVIVMFQEPLGWAMLAGAAMILGVGVFWMSRLVKVEV